MLKNEKEKVKEITYTTEKTIQIISKDKEEKILGLTAEHQEKINNIIKEKNIG